MSGLDDFLKGLAAFDQGITQYATGNAIRNAKSQMDELNATAMKDDERNAALQRLSKDLALNLGAIGAPVSQIEQAAGTVAPKIYGTPGEALFAGMQTGNKFAQDVGQKGLDIEEGRAIGKESRANAQRMRELQFGRDTALMEGMLKGQSRSELKPLSDKNIEALTKVDEVEALIGSIEEDLGKNKELTGPTRTARSLLPFSGLSISDAAAFQAKVKRLKQLHKLAATGMGSSDKESEEIGQSIPAEGERLETFQKKLSQYKSEMLGRRSTYLDRLKRAGRDTSDFSDLQNKGQALQQQQQSLPQTQTRVINGQTVIFDLNPATGKYRPRK